MQAHYTVIIQLKNQRTNDRQKKSHIVRELDVFIHIKLSIILLLIITTTGIAWNLNIFVKYHMQNSDFFSVDLILSFWKNSLVLQQHNTIDSQHSLIGCKQG